MDKDRMQVEFPDCHKVTLREMGHARCESSTTQARLQRINSRNFQYLPQGYTTRPIFPFAETELALWEWKHLRHQLLTNVRKKSCRLWVVVVVIPITKGFPRPTMSVQICEKDHGVLWVEFSYHLLQSSDFREQLHLDGLPSAVEVYTAERAAIITVDNTVNVDDRNDLEHKIRSKSLRLNAVVKR